MKRKLLGIMIIGTIGLSMFTACGKTTSNTESELQSEIEIKLPTSGSSISLEDALAQNKGTENVETQTSTGTTQESDVESSSPSGVQQDNSVSNNSNSDSNVDTGTSSNNSSSSNGSSTSSAPTISGSTEGMNKVYTGEIESSGWENLDNVLKKNPYLLYEKKFDPSWNEEVAYLYGWLDLGQGYELYRDGDVFMVSTEAMVSRFMQNNDKVVPNVNVLTGEIGDNMEFFSLSGDANSLCDKYVKENFGQDVMALKNQFENYKIRKIGEKDGNVYNAQYAGVILVECPDGEVRYIASDNTIRSLAQENYNEVYRKAIK